MAMLKSNQLFVNVSSRNKDNKSSDTGMQSITPEKDIYGTLSEKVIRPVYTPIDTDTLDLTLDNKEMTIKGDVKWQAFTGETAGTAYPGNLGARNYNMILKLRQEFDEQLEDYKMFMIKANDVLSSMQQKVEVFTETIQRGFDNLYSHVNTSLSDMQAKIVSLNKMDAVLLSTINKETENRIIACEEIHSIIKQETAHRVAAINKVHEKLDAEIERAINADKKLENVQMRHTAELEALRIRLDQVKESLNNKINENVTQLNDKILKTEELIRADLVEEVTRLDARIDTEIERATAEEQRILQEAKDYIDSVKDSILGEGITEAYDTLVEIENWLKTQGVKIKDIFLAITQETKARQTEDKLLWSAIHQETDRAQQAEADESLARQRGDTLLSTQISTETADRQQADTELNTQIQLNVQAIANEISRAKAAESELADNIADVITRFGNVMFIDGGTSISNNLQDPV